MKEDVTVLKVLRQSNSNGHWLTIIIYQTRDTKRIGYMEIPKFFSIDPRFGWEYKERDVLTQLSEGQYLRSGEILADSPSKDEEGDYKFGRNVNVCLASMAGSAEDSIIINENAISKFAYDVIERITIEIPDNCVPCNIYGDETLYKCCPEVGDTIRSDNIIMCLREVDVDTCPVQASKVNLMRIDDITDSVYQCHGPDKGVVVGIDIIKNVHKTTILGEPFDQLDRLASNQVKFRQSVFNAYKKIKGRRNVEVEEAFTNYLVKVGVIDGDGLSTRKSRVKLMKKRRKLETFTITFSIKKTLLPTYGTKFTDLSGSKGVIGEIRPADQMPRDINGVVADVVMAPDSTVARNVTARVYKQYFSNVQYVLSLKIANLLGVKKTTGKSKLHREIRAIYKRDRDRFNKAVDLLGGFYNIVNPIQRDALYALVDDETSAVKHMVDLVSNAVTLILNVDLISKRKAKNIATELKHSIYNPKIGPVTFNDKKGETHVTKSDIIVAYDYFLLLEKDGSSMSATSSIRLQAMGLTATSTKIDKDLAPIAQTNVTILGIDETGILASSLEPQGLAELVDRLNSSETHGHICNQILESDKPTGIDTIVNRSAMPYTGGRSLKIIKHMLQTYGVEIHYEHFKYK
jgi:hypothetical protein